MAYTDNKFAGKPILYPGTGRTPVPVLKWTGQRDSISLAGTSARVELPTGSVLIEISATENCYIAFGDDTVTASSTIATNGSRLFVQGAQMVPVPLDSGGEPFTYIAGIEAGGAGGVLQVEKVK